MISSWIYGPISIFQRCQAHTKANARQGEQTGGRAGCAPTHLVQLLILQESFLFRGVQFTVIVSIYFSTHFCCWVYYFQIPITDNHKRAAATWESVFLCCCFHDDRKDADEIRIVGPLRYRRPKMRSLVSFLVT